MSKRVLTERVARGWDVIKKFMFGLTGYEFARHAVEMRHQMESVFIVVTMGDMIGIPILPPIHSLRLLPYVMPKIAAWKREMARHKDFWEREEYDLHGV